MHLITHPAVLNYMKNKHTDMHTRTNTRKSSFQVTQKTQTQCYQALHFYQLSLPPSPQYSFLSLKSQKETGCAKTQTTSSPSPGKYITTLDNMELFSISSLWHCSLPFAPCLSNSSTTFFLPENLFCSSVCARVSFFQSTTLAVFPAKEEEVCVTHLIH